MGFQGGLVCLEVATTEVPTRPASLLVAARLSPMSATICFHQQDLSSRGPQCPRITSDQSFDFHQALYLNLLCLCKYQHQGLFMSLHQLLGKNPFSCLCLKRQTTQLLCLSRRSMSFHHRKLIRSLRNRRYRRTGQTRSLCINHDHKRTFPWQILKLLQ